MKAEIIAVGTEILTGQIVNTNAQFLSEKMAEIGIDVYYQTAVGDNEERLLSLLDLASRRSELIILCGGLGPTEDDLTKQTLAKYLNRNLEFDLKASQKLDAFFADRPKHVRTANNERQAQIVQGSTPLQNLTGLAVGGILTIDQVSYVVLPGPPSELKPMVQKELIPILSTDRKQLYSRVLRFFGIGESQLVTVLDDIIQHQTDPTIAPYAKTGEVTLRLSTKATNQKIADAKLDILEQQILSVTSLDQVPLKEYFYGYGDDNSLAKVVCHLLKDSNTSITAAESLTAGLFQSTLTEFSGASSFFQGGFVTYSLIQKASLLGIPQKDLEANGVVSDFTAKAMAKSAREKLDADIAVSLTGVAGPEMLENQPVGTVYIGLATRREVIAKKIVISGRSRSDIREIAVLNALNLVRQILIA